MKSGWILVLVVVLLFVAVTSCNEKEDDPWTNYDGSSITCRRVGCGRSPVYSDWNRRYCSTHIKETHYCRYPGCTNQIPNNSTGRYCSEHD